MEYKIHRYKYKDGYITRYNNSWSVRISYKKYIKWIHDTNLNDLRSKRIITKLMKKDNSAAS